jgi:hypothetical protein
MCGFKILNHTTRTDISDLKSESAAVLIVIDQNCFERCMYRFLGGQLDVCRAECYRSELLQALRVPLSWLPDELQPC